MNAPVPPQPLPGPTLPPLGPLPERAPGESDAAFDIRWRQWLWLADMHERQARRAMDWEKEQLCVAAQREAASAQRALAEAMRAPHPPDPFPTEGQVVRGLLNSGLFTSLGSAQALARTYRTAYAPPVVVPFPTP